MPSGRAVNGRTILAGLSKVNGVGEKAMGRLAGVYLAKPAPDNHESQDFAPGNLLRKSRVDE